MSKAGRATTFRGAFARRPRSAFASAPNNSDYTGFNAGLSRPIGKKLTLDVRYYDTNRGELGENFDNRVVGSIKLAL